MKKLLACALAAALLGMGALTQRATPPANGAGVSSPLPNGLKIMPLGDSITYGSPDPTYGGYRHLLGRLLARDGYIINFVGSRKSRDSDNEGHPGFGIPQIMSGIDAYGWLKTYQPDIILLHIGTNDILNGDVTSAPRNLSMLLDDILGRLPRTRIIVAQIIPIPSRSGPNQDLRSYNAAIPHIVASKGPRVSMVDMRNILSKGDYADDLHPNARGYDKMARAWEVGIRAATSGKKGQTPTGPGLTVRAVYHEGS